MKRLPIPPRDDPNKIKAFLEAELAPDTGYRIEKMSVWERARLMVPGQQWLEQDYGDDPTRTPYWKSIQVDETNWTPMPTYNAMVAPIQNETARLEGQGRRPYVRPTEDSPRKERAAKLARDILRSKLDDIRWRETEHHGCQFMSHFGTWVLKTYWDLDWTKTFRAPVTTARRCPSCGLVLASRSIPDAKVQELMGDQALAERFSVKQGLDQDDEPVFRATATHCLQCQETPPVPGLGPMPDGTFDAGAPGVPVPALESYLPTPDEAKLSKDYFGRPLGEDLPLGDVACECVNLWDFFPENQGIDVGPDGPAEFGETRVRSLDWIRNHFPTHSEDVVAETAEDLMRWHPVAGGSRDWVGGSMSDASMFSHHALAREWHKLPWVELDERTKKPSLNRGRSFAMAGRVLLYDGDFMLECHDAEGNATGELYPRVQYQIIPWEIRERETFGLGAAELIFSQQEAINTMLAQVQDARHRFGSPKLLCRQGMDLTYAGFADTGYNSDIYYYQADGDEQPIPFGNQQMSQEWVSEFRLYLEGINTTIGVSEAETGDVPGNTQSPWAAQALMYMGEKSSERRRNRIDRIREAKKRAYRHLLQLMQENYREDRQYTVSRSTSDRIAIKKFRGLDLDSQWDVEFDDEPAYDTRAVRRAATMDAVKLGTIVADTEIAKRKINKELGAPNDINEEQNSQSERAVNEWCGFFDEGKQPAVSLRGDNHTIHYQQHLRDFYGEDTEDLLVEVDWNQIELALWGSEDDFDQIMALEAELKLNPPTAQPLQALPGPDGQVTPADTMAAQQAWQQKMQQQQVVAALPKALELRLVHVWQKMLDQSGVFRTGTTPGPVPGVMAVTTDTERQKNVAKLLRWKAHTEAHFRTAQKLSGMAAAGAQMPAAPGGVETQAGTIPGSPGTSLPGSGAGLGATTAAGTS